MMSFAEFRRRYDLDLSILSAIFSLLLGALGMYFVYRWGEVLRVSDDQTRRLLLGDSFAALIDSGQALSLMISIYLGYKLLLLLLQASRLQRDLLRKKRQQVRYDKEEEEEGW